MLCKSVLGGLWIYYLSLFVMLVGIAKKLEALRAKFFWGGTEDEKKMTWIKWDQVLAKPERGGLDIGSLVSFNLSLIFIWKYRFFYILMPYGFVCLKRFMGIMEDSLEVGRWLSGRALGLIFWLRLIRCM